MRGDAMTEESVRVYKSSFELDINIGSLELHSGGGSPVRMEEENVLMSTEGEKDTQENPDNPLGVTTDIRSVDGQHDDTKSNVATGGQSDDDNVPDSPSPSDTPASRLHSVDDFVSAYDGCEVSIFPGLASSNRGRGRRVEKEVRNAILKYMPSHIFDTIPGEWLENYGMMDKGLMVHEGFRIAVYDTECLIREGFMEPLPDRDIEDCQDLDECGYTGMNIMKTRWYRLQEDIVQLDNLTDYMNAARAGEFPNSYVVLECDIEAEIARIGLDRLDTIQVLVRQEVAHREKVRKLDEIKKASDDKNRRTRLEEDLQKKRDEAIKKSDQKKGSHGKSGSGGKKPPREKSVGPDKDGFVEPMSHKDKLNQRKADKFKPDSARDGDDGPSGEEPMDDGDKGLPIKPDEADDKADSIHESATSTGGPETDTDDDVPAESQTEQQIWDNTKSHFRNRIPVCMADCKKSKNHYSCPSDKNMNGESDDEDWMRLRRSDPSPNKMYAVWFDKLRHFPLSYYDRDQKDKLEWANLKWYSVAERRISCPYRICVTGSEFPEVYPTRQRYIRHLVEVHMHHHPEYECDADRGKPHKECKGFVTSRRGEMVRHLIIHGCSLVKARARVMVLHNELMSQSELDTITLNKRFWCQTKPKACEKLVARFAQTGYTAHTNMEPDMFNLVCEWRMSRSVGSRLPK